MNTQGEKHGQHWSAESHKAVRTLSAEGISCAFGGGPRWILLESEPNHEYRVDELNCSKGTKTSPKKEWEDIAAEVISFSSVASPPARGQGSRPFLRATTKRAPLSHFRRQPRPWAFLFQAKRSPDQEEKLSEEKRGSRWPAKFNRRRPYGKQPQLDLSHICICEMGDESDFD